MRNKYFSILFLIYLFFTCSFVSSTKAEVDSLKDAFAKYFRIGTGIIPEELEKGHDHTVKHFNSITPGNELKPDFLTFGSQWLCKRDGNNVNTIIDFMDGTKATLKFCEDNQIPIRGHTFVWHSQTPTWLFKENFSEEGAMVSVEIMEQRLESLIKNTFEKIETEYPKLVIWAYDVCNEVFVNDGGGLRKDSPWYQVYGDDSFIISAFTKARKYAPKGCKLYLNDYNEYMEAKTEDIYNMAMKLKDLGIIDGIGMQAHLDVDFPSAEMFETAVKKFVSTGLDVQITELDITTGYEDTKQVELYKSIFEIAVKYSEHISCVTIWGTNDETSWRVAGNPLLFKNYEPKKAFYAVMEVAKNGGS